MVSCLESREERIIRKLNFELDSRGLEIDTVITINTMEILVSPRDYKKEKWTVALDDFIGVENEDSLTSLITQRANGIQAWFELPKWDDKSDTFTPRLTSGFNDSQIYNQKLTEKHSLSFYHTNAETHKITLVGKRLLSHWKMTEQEFEKWTRGFLEIRYKKDAQLIKIPHKNVELFQLKCVRNEQLPHSLIFTKNFKNEASAKIGYPFYLLLNRNFPIYISKKGDLDILKASLEEIESVIKQSDEFPTELITYTEDGIEISQIE